MKNWMHNKRMTDPVSGTYELTGCSGNDSNAAEQTCRMHGVVVAAGIDPTPVEHRCLAPTKRWPYPGQRLPVTVDRGDPTRLQIEWDEVPTRRSVAAESAETLATSMRTPEVKSAQETVLAAPGRPVPGRAGGGLTPEQAAAAASAPGLQRATARVLAVHEVQVPVGTPGAPPAGLVDITLDVTLTSGEGFSTTTRIGFSTPEKRARVATVGNDLPVFVDPHARDRIAVDGASMGL